MKMLLIGFIFWIFIVPSLAGSFLILAFLAAFMLLLYFALTWFVIASTTALVLCGPFGSFRSPALVPDIRQAVVTKQIHLRRKTMKRITAIKSVFSSLAFLCLVGTAAMPAHAAAEAA